MTDFSHIESDAKIIDLEQEIEALEATIAALKEERDEWKEGFDAANEAIQNLQQDLVSKNRLIKTSTQYIKSLEGLVQQRSKYPK